MGENESVDDKYVIWMCVAGGGIAKISMSFGWVVDGVYIRVCIGVAEWKFCVTAKLSFQKVYRRASIH